MHPVSVPANSTLPPVQTQKKSLAGRKEEEVGVRHHTKEEVVSRRMNKIPIQGYL